MTPAGWITLATIVFAALLLVSERLRPDLIALLVLLTLTLTRVVTPEEAFSGFSRSAVISILALFILTHGLEKTGVTRWLSVRLLRLAGPSETRLVVIVMLTAAGLSAFMNTIAAAAVLLPITMGIARHSGIRPSRLLMPLAFGALLGGTATLLTTANLLVSTTLAQAGKLPFGLFDFAPVGLPLVAAGTLVVVWLSPRLLPARDVAGEVARMRRLETELTQVYHLREGTSEVSIQPGSCMGGRTLHEGGWGHALGLTVLGILHQGRLRLAPDRDSIVTEGDILLLEGTPTREMIEQYGLRLTSKADLASALSSHDVPIVEVTLAPRSALEGQTLRQTHFRERYGLQAVAIWRQGLVVQQDVADVALQFGDAMLLQGPRDRLELLKLDPEFLVLEEAAIGRIERRGVLAVAILALSLALFTAGILPIAVSTMAGATLMVLTGCIRMEDVYRAVEWRTIFLVAGMLPLSIALESTGTGALIGEGLFRLTGGWGALGTAAALLVGTVFLSLFLGGQTVAVVVAPVAIAAAESASADPRAMAMAVAIGCSLAFVSPFGHPATMLVMGPGSYTLRDFVRLGTPVTLVSLAVTLAGLHWIWGL
jgi:di/tricarboxylate transporter